MTRLNWYLIREVIPVFFIAMIFLALSMELLDLFRNLSNYLNAGVAPASIIKTAILYLPKSLSYALPLSILFSVSYTLGSFYSHNELIAVFGSGISLSQFVRPLLILGVILSLFSFIFEETMVLPTLKAKNDLTKVLLKQEGTLSNSNVSVMGAKGRVIYNVAYYNDQNQSLSTVLIVIKNDKGRIQRRIDAEWADWKDNRWVLNKARVFKWDEQSLTATETYEENYAESPWVELLIEKPETFKRKTVKIEELSFRDAFATVEQLKAAGLPFRDAETDLYQRISFALIPFVVILLSSAIGGRFKTNILLASLMISLILAVSYYIIQMIMGLFAKMGYIPTLLGAAAGFVIALGVGIVLFMKART